VGVCLSFGISLRSNFLTLFTSPFKQSAVPTTIRIFSRPLHLPNTYPNIQTCVASFESLCATALSSADYTTLASTFRTIILTSVPVLTEKDKDKARRFITLIDALYEAGVKVVVKAEGPIEELFFSGKTGSDGEANERIMMEEAISEAKEVYRPNVSMYEQSADTGASEAGSAESRTNAESKFENLSMFTGESRDLANLTVLKRY